MNNTLLINRIETGDISDDKKKIFFQLGRLDIYNGEDKLIKVIKKMDILEKTDIIYKYNGVELNIEIKQIPKVIKILSRNNIKIYSVFERYDPKL